MSRFLKQHELIAGILLMFLFTWPIDLGIAAYSRGLIGIQVPFVVGVLVGYGIVFATILITALTRGWAGVKALLRQFLIWRVGWKWYGVALFLPPILMLLSISLSSLVNGISPDFSIYYGREIFGPEVGPLLLALPFFLYAMLTNGEEIGWRGFVLPHLQQKHNALIASLILGVIWAFWHLPKYLMVDTNLGGGKGLDQFLIESVKVLAFSILYTWLFNNTKSSLLLVTMFHAAWNTAWVMLPIQNVGVADLVIYWLCAVAVVLIYGPAQLVRKTTFVSSPAVKPNVGN
jgi:uncharacterized protein